MAMTIFFVLNGLGVIFLLYVLANFWKEGHRPKCKARKDAKQFRQRGWADLVVLTHTVSHSAQEATSVIPFQSRPLDLRDKPSCGPIQRENVGVSVRRISTR